MKQRGVVDPAGSRVAANIARLRTSLGLSQHALAERLTAAGFPMARQGVTRVEAGYRVVYARDLAAFALALDTNPNGLLLPETADPHRTITLAGSVNTSERAAWQWATGEQPLPDLFSDGNSVDLTRRERFREQTRPHKQGAKSGQMPAAAVEAARTAIIAALGAGMEPADLHELVDLAATVEHDIKPHPGTTKPQ